MKLFILALLSFTVISCSKQSPDAPVPVPSELAQKIAASAAGGLAGALQCSHPDVIQKALAAELAKLPMLSQKSLIEGQKGLGAQLCVPAVSIVLPMLIGAGLNQIPADWGCQGTSVSSGITAIAQKACALIPF